MLHFIKKYYKQMITVFIFAALIVIMISKSFDATVLIKEKSKELKQIYLDYALAEKFLENVYEFEKTSEYVSKEKSKLNVLMPNNDDDKISLFSELEDIASDTGNGISLTVVNDKIVKKKTTATAAKTKETTVTKVKPLTENNIKLNIVLIGNQNDMMDFLQKIENMRYFNDILSVATEKITPSLNNKEKIDDTKTNLIKTTMVVVFYLEDNK